MQELDEDVEFDPYVPASGPFPHHQIGGVDTDVVVGDVEPDFGQGKGGPPVAGTSSLFADEDQGVEGANMQAADSG